MSGWIDTVHSMAAQLGIPTKVVDSVIGVESNFSPTATGDNGTSFGIFQLHEGGQLGGLSAQQAYDPVTNARVALPYLQRGMQQAGAFTDTSAWWLTFAEASGHPGNGPQAYSEAAKLKQAYDTGQYSSADGSFSGVASGNTGGAAPVSPSTGTSSSDVLTQVGSTITLLLVGAVLLVVGVVFLAS